MKHILMLLLLSLASIICGDQIPGIDVQVYSSIFENRQGIQHSLTHTYKLTPTTTCWYAVWSFNASSGRRRRIDVVYVCMRGSSIFPVVCVTAQAYIIGLSNSSASSISPEWRFHIELQSTKADKEEYIFEVVVLWMRFQCLQNV